MDANLREHLRINLLRQAEAASLLGLTDGAFLVGARTQGYPADLEEVGAEIDYLVDKGFLSPAQKPLSPEIRRHRINAAGRDFLAIHA